MKIVLARDPAHTKFLADDGSDLSHELRVHALLVTQRSHEPLRVLLEVMPTSVELAEGALADDSLVLIVSSPAALDEAAADADRVSPKEAMRCT